jgi:DNA replication licensing factor MCM2
MIRVVGVVTRRTGVFPLLMTTAYDCGQCNQLLGPFPGGLHTSRPTNCISCQGMGPFRINNQKSEYGNYQKMTIQETPGSVPPGRVPRYKDVILLGDLIDCARPGEEVEVIGIFSHQPNHQFNKDSKNSFPVVSTIIDAISVQKKNGANNNGLSEDDKRRIRELSVDPQVINLLHSINSNHC